MSEEETRKVKEKFEAQLLKIQGVTGVGYNGSINIYVERLTPKLAAFLPKNLNGIKVRVIQTGKLVPLNTLAIPVAQAIYANRTSRFRPAPGGVSCGHPQVTAGTLTCRAIDKKLGEVFGLSNNHVIALRWGNTQIGVKGDSTLQPGPTDGGIDDAYYKLGELERWIPVELEPAANLIDAAVFRSDQLSKLIEEIGEVESSIPARIGMNLVKSGRTSGLNYSSVFDVNATVKVSGDGDCIFKDQIIAQPAFLSPGDSGSWVGEADSFRTVGIGFAGSPETSIINKAANVEELLDIVIVPLSPSYIPSLSPAVTLGLFGAFLGTAQLTVNIKKKQ